LEGSSYNALAGILFFLLKVVFFAFSFMWVRWTLPRFRYDTLMNIGWKKLIPWALINIVIAAVYVVYWKGSIG
jgi:NADH-quinone oxidoreductase subunit H